MTLFAQPDADALAKLREPFGPEHVGKLPKPTSKEAAKGKCAPKGEGGAAPDWQDYYCGGWHGLPAVHLDYVGHAAITARLLDVDPVWNWEPAAVTEDGRPRFELDRNSNPVGLWIKLTVCGVTRLGFGSVTPSSFDAEKQLIGDALRNAAMRFGMALDLWVKGHAEDDEKVASQDERTGPERAPDDRPARPSTDGWSVGAAKNRLLKKVGAEHIKQAWIDLKGDERWQSWEAEFPTDDVDAWLNPAPVEEGAGG
jgi:hypothetical protein